MEKAKLISLDDFISGSSAGIVQVLLGQPLDLIKIRMQTQPEIYKSIVQAAKHIQVNEGLSAFYKGTLSPLLGISFCVAIQFGSNEFAKNFFKNRNFKTKNTSELSVKDLVMCGMFAGFCNAFAISPVELIRIKLQIQSQGEKKYNGTLDCYSKIIKQYGLNGLYQGLSSTIFREIPAYAVYFGLYETFMKGAEKKHGNRKKIPLLNVMGYGAISGFFLWLVTFPNDVIKTRMQADPIDDRKCRTIASTTNIIYREKGIGGFYKGLSPCLVRSLPINAATFLTFELVQKFLKKNK